MTLGLDASSFEYIGFQSKLSAALAISEVPFPKPVASVRVGLIEEAEDSARGAKNVFFPRPWRPILSQWWTCAGRPERIWAHNEGRDCQKKHTDG